ncbi:uncharacterized protein LOC125666368 [Ostrea edulis]|uniref:uncharacterized protein LOC125666368 n=1 Tax=Ostrea edulis TaxID=37623 RepID=UPI0024AFCB18|nr:uncharacterized protein LOC125666368 [Ostrea edulis]
MNFVYIFSMKTRSNDAIVTFKDICLTLKDKVILNNVNGRARSGQILAIMGPTGSGKTSLLNILAGNVSLTSGSIDMNGNPFTKLQRRKQAYILQNDLFLSRLTLRETLYFTAMIRLPDHVSKTNKMARIEEIVDALHLRKCLDTTMGDSMHKGLSGGEKKRASIACELLTDPDIMLIDEPTSGLDSSTAYVLMEELRDFASQYNKMILTTIHQPSNQIFHMFSSLTLLVNGKTAYFGDAQTALQYFSDLGLTFPDHFNTADVLLELVTTTTDVVNKILEESDKRKIETDDSGFYDGKTLHADEADTHGVVQSNLNGNVLKTPTSNEVVCLGYHKRDPTGIVLDVSSLQHMAITSPARSLNRKWGISFWTQFRMLCWRNVKQSRSRVFDECIIAHALIFGCVFSVIYYQMTHSLDTFHDRMGAVFLPLVIWGFHMIFEPTISFMEELEVVRKERKSGAYRLSAYYTAKMVSGLPMSIVLPVAQLTAMFWFVGFGGPIECVMYVGLNLLSCFTLQSLGYIVGAFVQNVKYSFAVVNTTMVIFILLGGFFNTSFPTWFSWAKYLSILHYPFAAIVTLLFGDIEPFRCGNSEIYLNCKNETQIITGSDVLNNVGIDLPVYCCIGTLVALVIPLRVLGYYVIKYKLYNMLF